MGTESKERTAGEAGLAEGKVPPSEVLRETFLAILDPEEADTFRRSAGVIQDRLLDRAAYEEKHPQFSYTLAEMTGVAADLFFLQRFLLQVAAERRLSELTPTEEALAALADRLAPGVQALAEGLEQELARLISDETPADEMPADEPKRAPEPPGQKK
jgi:hypothetical protein